MEADPKQQFAKERFESIYRENVDSIFRFCLVRVSNREQAMDITQEAFLRLWVSFCDGKNINNCRAFLFTVAHRLVIDWWRKKKSLSLEKIMNQEMKREFDIEDETLGDVVLGAEGRFILEKIDLLPDSYQHPVYLRFVEGLSPEEIGGILGISGNAAGVRINRGIAYLRKLIGI